MIATFSQADLDACIELSRAYAERADAGNAEALAALYTPDGVFDRLGQTFEGRAAITEVIRRVLAGVWTEHRCSNHRIEPDADGNSASGRVDLEMRRGQPGSDKFETLHAEYHDRYVRTPQGWQFALRRAVLKT